MGKLLDRDVLVAHLERMMAARQIDRLPKSGYAKAIEDVAGCPTVEPRVMALEELAAAQKTPVWRETKRIHKDLYNGWMLAYDIQRGQGITGTRQGMTEPNGRVGWCKLDDYGKTWRCWTSRPTNEQREATPWE